jgi:uncharacterized membrane protein SpoIIM required for sporulation
MNVEEFYQSRQASWKRLTDLLSGAERDISRMSPEQIAELGRLYRAATSDLALARRDFPRQKVTIYLNQLVGRAHAVVYRSEPLAIRRLGRFIVEGYPRLYREAFPFIFVATLLFGVAALIAGISTSFNPVASRWLLPPGIQELIPAMQDKELWTEIPISQRPYASSFIMQNNIRVAILAFGAGILAGLMTVWIMVSNGLQVGGIVGLTTYYGVGFEMSTFMIGHGVVELSVIMIAGGSGLMLGWAIIHPGLYSRRNALLQAAGKAVLLLVGCIPLLVIAGLIEGFISPNELIPWPVKWGIGIATGLLMHGYLLLAGRSNQ